MNSQIRITDHYNDRFRERIAKTKRIEKFATDAYTLGESDNSTKNKNLKKHLQAVMKNHGDTCVFRIYKGFIHIFDDITKTAITVYRVPNCYR